MILQGWPQLGFIAGIALQNPKPAYDAPIHLREPHLPTELGLLTCLAPPNYGRVLLEDGNQLLRGRNLLPFKHPPAALRNDLIEVARASIKQAERAPLGAYFAPARLALLRLWQLRSTSRRPPGN